MSDRTAGQRMLRYRQRPRAAGKRELRIWVTEAEAAAIRAYLGGAPFPAAAPASVPPVQLEVRVWFDRKPARAARQDLSKAGLRWDGAAKVWHGVCTQAQVDSLAPLVKRLGGTLQVI